MKKSIALIALSMILVLCFVACDKNTVDPSAQTTDAVTTEEVLTAEQPTTEEITTEEPTTEEPTTEAVTTTEEVTTAEPWEGAPIEDIKFAAVAFLDADDMLAAANNPQQDWSDFGGLTVNEDGSVTALFRMGTNDVWDPYCYLLKQPTTVGDYMVIKYQIKYDFRVRLYMGTEGNAATGAGDCVMTEFFATEGDDWGYLVMDLREEAMAYDTTAASLGYLRLGLDMAESGDTVTIAYIAFFNSMDVINELIPY